MKCGPSWSCLGTNARIPDYFGLKSLDQLPTSPNCATSKRCACSSNSRWRMNPTGEDAGRLRISAEAIAPTQSADDIECMTIGGRTTLETDNPELSADADETDDDEVKPTLVASDEH